MKNTLIIFLVLLSAMIVACSSPAEFDNNISRTPLEELENSNSILVEDMDCKMFQIKYGSQQIAPTFCKFARKTVRLDTTGDIWGLYLDFKIEVTPLIESFSDYKDEYVKTLSFQIDTLKFDKPWFSGSETLAKKLDNPLGGQYWGQIILKNCIDDSHTEYSGEEIPFMLTVQNDGKNGKIDIQLSVSLFPMKQHTIMGVEFTANAQY